MSILISHVGIVVSDFEGAIERYKLITGDNYPRIIEVPDQKAWVAMFSGSDTHGGGRIELVAPTSDDSPVALHIAKRGEGLHHICIYVEDIEAHLADLKKAGARLIDETPRVGAEGNKIAFVHPASGGGVLIELEQR